MKKTTGLKTYVCTLAEAYMVAAAYQWMGPKCKSKPDWTALVNKAFEAAEAFERAAWERGEIFSVEK